MQHKLINKKLLSLLTGLLISVLYLLNVDIETVSRFYVLLSQASMICVYIYAENKLDCEKEKKELFKILDNERIGGSG